MAIEAMVSPTARNDEDHPNSGDDEALLREQTVRENLAKARSLKGHPKDAPLLPVVCGGTMMYIQVGQQPAVNSSTQ